MSKIEPSQARFSCPHDPEKRWETAVSARNSLTNPEPIHMPLVVWPGCASQPGAHSDCPALSRTALTEEGARA